MKWFRYVLCIACALPTTHAIADETQLGNIDSFYPRAVRLQASGTNNGRLIASIDVANAGNIYESLDDGASWTKVGTVTEPEAPCCTELYEVPRTLGQTTAGTLFWATSVNLTGAGPRGIRIYKSTDIGRSWSYHSMPVSNGRAGLWEAEFAIDSQGRLIVYYASEEHKTAGYNQLIAHKISTDGGRTWGNEVFDIAIGGGIERPGMPTVTKLPNGSYIMVYEICGASNCDTFMRTSPNGVDWGNPADKGKRIESIAGHHFSHAPTVNWINDGTTNGVLVAAGQVLRNANNTNAAMNGKVFMVNKNLGTGLWEEMQTPLFTPSDGKSPCTNYSTQLIAGKNNRELIQLANRNCRFITGKGLLNNPVNNGVYRLIAQHSNKALDVSGCSTASGANVQQWPWTGGDCQRWYLENINNGYYRITSKLSGQALEVAGCAMQNGGNVQQWPRNDAECQLWKIEQVGDGYYRLIAKHSGKVLDVSECSTANAANVQQWDWLGGGCQRWRLEPVSANEIAADTYTLIAQHSNQALDVAGCATNDGANVQQWPVNGALCQQWKIQATADGFYQLISQQSNKALDVDNCSTNNGGDLHQWTQNTADCQKWNIERIAPDYYRLLSKFSGKALDVSGCSQANGANVQQWQWLDVPCQRWALQPINASSSKSSVQSSVALSSRSSAISSISLSSISQSSTQKSSSIKSSVSSASNSVLDCTLGTKDQWNNGFVLNNITVTNRSTMPVQNWQVRLQFSSAIQVTGNWNSAVTQNGNIITVRNASFNGALTPGQSATFGLQGSHAGNFIVPECLPN